MPKTFTVLKLPLPIKILTGFPRIYSFICDFEFQKDYVNSYAVLPVCTDLL